MFFFSSSRIFCDVWLYSHSSLPSLPLVSFLALSLTCQSHRPWSVCSCTWKGSDSSFLFCLFLCPLPQPEHPASFPSHVLAFTLSVLVAGIWKARAGRCVRIGETKWGKAIIRVKCRRIAAACNKNVERMLLVWKKKKPQPNPEGFNRRVSRHFTS